MLAVEINEPEYDSIEYLMDVLFVFTDKEVANQWKKVCADILQRPAIITKNGKEMVELMEYKVLEYLQKSSIELPDTIASAPCSSPQDLLDLLETKSEVTILTRDGTPFAAIITPSLFLLTDFQSIVEDYYYIRQRERNPEDYEDENDFIGAEESAKILAELN